MLSEFLINLALDKTSWQWWSIAAEFKITAVWNTLKFASY